MRAKQVTALMMAATLAVTGNGVTAFAEPVANVEAGDAATEALNVETTDEVEDVYKRQEKNNLWYTDAEIRKQMQDMYEVYQNTMETCSDIIAPAYNYEGLQCNWRQGKVSAFLTVENGCIVDGKMERIDKLYQMGVRLITLTWNDDNCFGHPHAKEAERMQLGLTPFGRKAVTYMRCV